MTRPGRFSLTCWHIGGGSGRFDIGEVAFAELFDGFHDVDEGLAFFAQAVFDAGRDFEVRLALHKAGLFQHLETLRERSGAGAAQRVEQLAEAFRAGEQRVDDNERPAIAEQA